ncbi:MAG: hypothetical protein WEG56_00240 [Chloroflexota bacterium]
MRRTWKFAGPVLTAALALVALPGLVGSHAPSVVEPLPASAFQPLPITALGPSAATADIGLDEAHVSDGTVEPGSPFVEPADAPQDAPPARARARQPEARADSIRRPPRYTLRGEATFYDHGTTAMRLPRGTVVVICGDGGCIERVVNDYGPQKPSRIVDLYRPDFFAICGCGWWEGVVDVVVYVY